MTSTSDPDYQRAIAYPTFYADPAKLYGDIPLDDLPIKSRVVPLRVRIISNIVTFVVCAAYIGFMVWVGVNHGDNGTGLSDSRDDLADAAAVMLAGAAVLIVALIVTLIAAGWSRGK